MFSLPVAIGMVIFTLHYFSGPDVPRYVFFTVAYTWFCSVSIIILVPADIWTVMHTHLFLFSMVFVVSVQKRQEIELSYRLYFFHEQIFLLFGI